jgi:hypothetical protein
MLDSQVAMVVLVDSRSQQTQTGAQYEVQDDRGWMRLRVENVSSGDTDTLFTVPMGAIAHERGETSIAYQGGGVWRNDTEQGSRMISPPEFYYRDAALTLPVITINGTGTSSNSLEIERQDALRRSSPSPSSRSCRTCTSRSTT